MELRNEYIHVRCDKGTKKKLIEMTKVFVYLSQADIVEQALNEFYLKYEVSKKFESGENVRGI